jgi:exodeoxyribonuclease-3
MGVQEIRAQPSDISTRFDTLGGMKGYFHCAQKKGYAGVGLYSIHEPSDLRLGFGDAEFDAEGRWLEARFDTLSRKLSFVSAYFPSGSSGEERQQAKWRFLNSILPILVQMKSEREFILMGDINIAHQNIDIKNWKGNTKNSGFLPEERAWMDHLFGPLGLIDVYRSLYPTKEQYTWWSQRGQARKNNVGWRIDYQISTPIIGSTATTSRVYTDQMFSDHAPVITDYDFSV